jgi:hypothetical protein
MGVMTTTSGSSKLVDPRLAAKFQNLASRWKRDTRFCSSRARMIEHPAYQEIIATGTAALPSLFMELRTDSHYWFPALRAIIGEDPIGMADRGVVRKMTEAWLEWAETRGY